MKSIPWDVFLIVEESTLYNTLISKKLIDTVYYDSDCSAWYVHSGLIEHDGYPYDIIVRNSIMHKELQGRDIEEYAYDIEQDSDEVLEMYCYPADNNL